MLGTYLWLRGKCDLKSGQKSSSGGPVHSDSPFNTDACEFSHCANIWLSQQSHTVLQCFVVVMFSSHKQGQQHSLVLFWLLKCVLVTPLSNTLLSDDKKKIGHVRILNIFRSWNFLWKTSLNMTFDNWFYPLLQVKICKNNTTILTAFCIGIYSTPQHALVMAVLYTTCIQMLT